ncbi:TetR/AcrR family transcriptional regulator [Rhizobium sp. BG4]|uniref:TetR/AcrR family transcriptional regulator n=1 Tax=Rhizobium sp. BG4 TaxID=2613770 RepID=UPI00193D06B3|nr:TetR/AcrR family transcriptional regulator [Rhizobium sp. BG4]QRM45073.1 TetR/AcrR family transcriptional regulator [Rhizobium sp. BG4]
MTTLAPEDVSRSRGRPREFDMDAALDKALLVFSERGYHATSISELTEAMGLTSGSVYKAFKDKRGVFLAAFDRYRAIRRGKISESMVGAETGRDKLRALLGLYAVSSHGESGRRGCLVVGSANEISTFDAEAAKRIEDAYTSNEEFILDLIIIGQADGSISPSVDPAAAAISLLCVMNGMRIVGKTGSTAAEMNAVAETAMKLLT